MDLRFLGAQVSPSRRIQGRYFYILEWSSIVSDIHEQYTLELSETLSIAERLGIAHPTDPRTRQAVVMTTDFVNTINRAGKLIDQARSIKYSQDLSSNRTLEKLEIERVYWSERKIDWGIVTEHEVEPIFATNVSWVHAYRETTALSPAPAATIRRVEAVLTPRVNEQLAPLRQLTDACSDMRSAIRWRSGSGMKWRRELAHAPSMERSTRLERVINSER